MQWNQIFWGDGRKGQDRERQNYKLYASHFGLLTQGIECHWYPWHSISLACQWYDSFVVCVGSSGMRSNPLPTTISGWIQRQHPSESPGYLSVEFQNLFHVSKFAHLKLWTARKDCAYFSKFLVMIWLFWQRMLVWGASGRFTSHFGAA